jgi:hypothetical protein
MSAFATPPVIGPERKEYWIVHRSSFGIRAPGPRPRGAISLLFLIGFAFSSKLYASLLSLTKNTFPLQILLVLSVTLISKTRK